MRMRDLAIYGAIAAVVLASVGMLVAAQNAPGNDAEGTMIAQARPQRGGGDQGDREARMAQYREEQKQRLLAAGATEADVQAIDAYRGKQRSIMEPLGQALQAVRDAAGDDGSDAKAKAALSAFEAAKTKALSDLAKAEEDLKAQLKLATKPRLHAILLSTSVLDTGMRGGSRFGGGGFRGRGAGGGGTR